MKLTENDITIEDDGTVSVSVKAWKYLLRLSGTKAATEQGQKRAVKRLIEKALDAAFKGEKK